MLCDVRFDVSNGLYLWNEICVDCDETWNDCEKNKKKMKRMKRMTTMMNDNDDHDNCFVNKKNMSSLMMMTTNMNFSMKLPLLSLLPLLLLFATKDENVFPR